MKNKFKIQEIKYFTKDGTQNNPNGSYFQKGGFMMECYLNKRSFVSNNYQEILVQNSTKTHRFFSFHAVPEGWIILFPNNCEEIELNESEIITWLNNNFQLNFSIGKFFHGSYISSNGRFFDESSMAIEIVNLKFKNLLNIAESLVTLFNRETLIMKDLKRNVIYLMDRVGLEN